MKQVTDITQVERRIDPALPLWLGSGAAAAVVGIGGSLALAAGVDHGWDRLLETYLVSFSLFLALTLGALFFVLLQHVTRSGWSVVVRRIAESIATNIWLMAVMVVPILLGMKHLYHWSHAEGKSSEKKIWRL